MIRKRIGSSHYKLVQELCRLSMSYGVVTHVGSGVCNDDESAEPTWYSVAAFGSISGVRLLGRSGGHPVAPMVRLLPADSQARRDVSATLAAMWQG